MNVLHVLQERVLSSELWFGGSSSQDPCGAETIPPRHKDVEQKDTFEVFYSVVCLLQSFLQAINLQIL